MDIVSSVECRSEFLLANVCLSLTNEGHWYGVIWLDSHSSCLLLSNRTGRENPGTHRPHLFYIYRGILELKPSKALPFWHSIILNFTPQKEKKKTLHTFLSWDKVGQELLAAIPFILWLGTLSTMAVISAQGVHDLKTLPRVTGWETERQAIIGPWHQWRRLNQNVQKGSRVGMSGGVYECFLFLPHLLLCWWMPPPPPEVCTRASVCADVVPLWNVQHSPESHLLNRRQGFPRVPPARRRCRPPGSCHRDPHPLPGWASSGAPLEGEP